MNYLLQIKEKEASQNASFCSLSKKYVILREQSDRRILKDPSLTLRMTKGAQNRMEITLFFLRDGALCSQMHCDMFLTVIKRRFYTPLFAV